MLPIGFSSIVAATLTNTILQTIADEGKRGRAVSIHPMCFLGTPRSSRCTSAPAW